MQVQRSHIGDEQNSADVREHDLGRLQDVVSRHLPSFYRVAYRYVGDPHDAEDVVQDALLSACRHLDQFKGKAKLTTWLTSIVANSALTNLRKRRRRHLHISLDERLADEQDFCVSDILADVRPSPEDENLQSELLGRLMQFVTELSPSLRTAIQLRDFDGLNTNEIAHVLGLPHGTVKSQVSRARSTLKQLMFRDKKGRLTQMRKRRGLHR